MTLFRQPVMRCILALVFAFTAAGPGAQPTEGAPEAIVERVVTSEGRRTRLSLFTNRVAVVRITKDGLESFSNQLMLDHEDFMVYLGAVNLDAEAISQMNLIPSSFEDSPPSILRMRIEGRGLVEVRYPRAALTELPMARLSMALDDLETQVMTVSPSVEALRGWEPRRDDVVELFSGGRARVIDVLPEGLLKLEHLELSIIEFVPLDSRARVIQRVLETPE